MMLEEDIVKDKCEGCNKECENKDKKNKKCDNSGKNECDKKDDSLEKSLNFCVECCAVFERYVDKGNVIVEVDYGYKKPVYDIKFKPSYCVDCFERVYSNEFRDIFKSVRIVRKKRAFEDRLRE